MSTNFLNRRMDLIHSYLTISNTNCLTMDTSYPVKLAGMVVKLFIANVNYNSNKFVLQNSSKQIILTVEPTNIYDFAGRVIKDNIGTDKAYEVNTNVYKKNDYVFAVIDFDHKKIYLCSQTNFGNFITGGVTEDPCKFRLFDISGDDEVKIGDEIKSINTELFSEAVNFNNIEDNHSFVRDSSDNVVYQIPTEETKTEGGISTTVRNYVPVADVDTINVNSFNTSCFPLLFPNILTSYTESFETVSSIRNYVQVSGVVNNNFIDKYCHTADEIKNLSFINYNESTKEISCREFPYIISYIYDIFKKGKQNDYVYFIRDTVPSENQQFKTSKYKYSQYIIPISKSKHKFSTIDIAESGNKNICNGNAMELNFNNSLLSNNLIGNWWDHTLNNERAIPYTYANNNNKNGYYAFKLNDNKTDKLDIVRNFKKHLDIYNNISKYEDSVNPNFNYLSFTNMNINYILNNSRYSYVNKFINFFGNNDNVYKTYIRDNIFGSNVSGSPAFVFADSEEQSGNITTNIDMESCPVTAVTLYPNNLSELLLGSSNESLLTKSESWSNITKIRYTYAAPVNTDSFYIHENDTILFKLMYFASDVINNDANNLNISIKNTLDGTNEIRNYHNNRTDIYDYFRFKISEDLRPNSSNFSNSIIVHENTDDDKSRPDEIMDDYTFYIVNFYAKMSPRMIGYGYENDTNLSNKLVTDIGFIRKFIFTRVYLAKKNTNLLNYHYLEFDSDGNLNFCQKINDNIITNQLYVVTSGSTNDLVYIRANFEKVKAELNYNGSVYLYYESGGSIYRIRYYCDLNTYASNWTTLNGNTISTYDYFTYPKHVLNITISDVNDTLKYGLYDRAWAALLNESKVTGNITTTSYTTRICDVVKHYYLYRDTILNNKQNYVIGNISLTNVPSFAIHKYNIGGSIEQISTLDLSINIDVENRVYYRGNQDLNIKDLIGTDEVFVYQNGPAPKVSRIKNNNNSYIYNIETYTDFISNVLATKTTNIASNVSSTKEAIYPVLNEAQLKYVNSVGIRKEYYEGKTLGEFYRNMAMYDLGKPMSNQKLDTFQLNHMIFEKGAFNNVARKESLTRIRQMYTVNGDATVKYAVNSRLNMTEQFISYNVVGGPYTMSPAGTYMIIDITTYNDYFKIKGLGANSSVEVWVKYDVFVETYDGFVDQSGNQVVLSSPIVIESRIDSSNRYGFNRAYIYNESNIDVTKDYVINEKIYASTEKAGNKKTTNISLEDESGIMLNFNGILGEINVDNINWETLLLALSNNKTVVLLSNALKDIKHLLDEKFISTSQNVSDTIESNVNVDEGKFEKDYGIYKYNDDEGYDSNNTRTINNKGVIVFVTEGGFSTVDKHGSSATSNWTYSFTPSSIHPKRMYISKDGLLCTKDYYDNDVSTASTFSIRDEEEITTITTLKNRINTLESRQALISEELGNISTDSTIEQIAQVLINIKNILDEE